MAEKYVLLDHDGGVDDLLALLFVLTMEEACLVGVNVTPADCYPAYAVEASRKILDLMGHLAKVYDQTHPRARKKAAE